MADSDSSQSWIGNPPAIGVGQYNSTLGKIVLVMLPLHDNYRVKLQGSRSSINSLSIYLMRFFNHRQYFIK